jgi:hypothetical protein
MHVNSLQKTGGIDKDADDVDQATYLAGLARKKKSAKEAKKNAAPASKDAKITKRKGDSNERFVETTRVNYSDLVEVSGTDDDEDEEEHRNRTRHPAVQLKVIKRFNVLSFLLANLLTITVFFNLITYSPFPSPVLRP